MENEVIPPNQETEKDHEFVRRLFRTRGYLAYLLQSLIPDTQGNAKSADEMIKWFERVWAEKPGRPTQYDHDFVG